MQEFDRSYAFIRRSLSILGLGRFRPASTRWEFFKHYWWPIFLVFHEFLIASAHMIKFVDFVMTEADLSTTVSPVVYALADSMSICKTIAVLYFMPDMLDVWTRLREMYGETEKDPRATAINKGPLRGMLKITTVLIMLYMTVNCAFIFAPPIYYAIQFLGGKPIKFILPFDLYFPLDWRNNTFCYLIVFFDLVVGATYTLISISSIDSYLYFCLTHISTQFDILGDKILNIIDDHVNCDDDDIELEKFELLNDKLEQYITKHQYLIALTRKLNKIFTASFLGNLLISSLIICMCAFQVATPEDVPLSHTIEFFLTMSAKTFQILLLSWFCQKVTDASLNISNNIYNSKWYLADGRFKTSILIMLARAQYPVEMTAWGFSVVNLSLFTSVMSTSWSYFTILRRTTQQRLQYHSG